MAHRLQLGLTSEYERFNGGTAYIEGSTAENPQAVMMFLNLPNHRSVERIESSMSDKAQLAEAKRIIHAANNYDALLAAAVAAYDDLRVRLIWYAQSQFGASYEDAVKYTDTAVPVLAQLKAAIAAAESEER